VHYCDERSDGKVSNEPDWPLEMRGWRDRHTTEIQPLTNFQERILQGCSNSTNTKGAGSQSSVTHCKIRSKRKYKFVTFTRPETLCSNLQDNVERPSDLIGLQSLGPLPSARF